MAARVGRDGELLGVTLDDVTTRFTVVHAGGTVWLAVDGHVAALREHERLASAAGAAASDGAVTAPMPGTVTVVQVSLGDQVEAGTPLLVVEAMKMEHVLTAPVAGTVTELPVTAGHQVRLDERVAVVTPPADPTRGTRVLDYRLDEETEALRKVVREFAVEVIAPQIGGFYERDEFPTDIVRQMGELGLFGLPFPEEYGGSGGDYFTLCVALEELARVDSSVAITLEAGVSLGAMPIFRFGTEEQKREWLPRLCAGRGAGRVRADRARRRLGRRRHPDHRPARGRRVGDQRLQGVHHQLGHRHHRPGHGHRGHRHAGRRRQGDLRDHRAGGHPRLHRRPAVLEGRLERLGHPRAVLRRTAGCRRRTWSASAAAATPSSCRSWTRAGSRSPRSAVGLAQGCVDESVKYAKEREAFGRPIGAQPGDPVQDRRHGGAGLTPPGWPTTTRPRRMLRGEPFKREAAIAKLYCSEMAVTNAREATQVHGGYGFMNEFPVARIWRDSKILEIGEGTSEVQRMLIARSLGVRRSSRSRPAGAPSLGGSPAPARRARRSAQPARAAGCGPRCGGVDGLSRTTLRRAQPGVLAGARSSTVGTLIGAVLGAFVLVEALLLGLGLLITRVLDAARSSGTS